MSSDNIRNVTAAIVSIVIVAGGMVQIYVLLKDGIISGDAGLAILGPLIGAAAAFVFQRESATNSARAAERAVSLGANAAVPPTPPPAAPETDD